MAVVWVALGGAVGSALRYLVSVFSAALFGTEFPWGTLIVNIFGCFAMGIFTYLLFGKLTDSQNMRLFLTTGVLGGFTTFSAFSLDAVALFERSGVMNAVIYVLATVLFSLGAVLFGFFAARVLV
jgi:fluoride exporter